MPGGPGGPAPAAPDLSAERLVRAGVRYAVDGPVLTVTLDRPEQLNPQLPSTWHVLGDIGRSAPGTIRVAVVRGVGRAFSAGLDRRLLAGEVTDPESPPLGSFAGLPPEVFDTTIDGFQEGFRWLRRPDLVSVAAVQGHAVGAGLQLPLACDIIVADETASLAMGELALGIVPDLGGTWPLVQRVGYGRALAICATARPVPAREALAIGLVDQVVPVGELDAAVAALVAGLLTHRHAAVTEVKALLAGAGGRTRAEQEAAERQAQHRRFRDLAGLAD